MIQSIVKTSNNSPLQTEKPLYDRVALHLENARSTIVRSVNREMLTAYWHIGREIVEEEQKGATRAEYGKALIKELSEQLIKDFGPGYGVSTLRDMRQFYLIYSDQDSTSPIHHTVCGELKADSPRPNNHLPIHHAVRVKFNIII